MNQVGNDICAIIIGFACSTLKEWASIKLVNKCFYKYCNIRMSYENIHVSCTSTNLMHMNIQRISRIRNISIHGFESINNQLERITAYCNNIRNLCLYTAGYHLDSIGFHCLFRLSNLNRIAISDCVYLTYDSMEDLLSRLPNLSSLEICNCKNIRDEDGKDRLMKSELSQSHIEKIMFYFQSISISLFNYLAQLSHLTNLRCISFCSCFFYGIIAEIIEMNSNLIRLNSDCKLELLHATSNEIYLLYYSNFNVDNLIISNSEAIDDDGLISILPMISSLSSLTINSCINITDKSIVCLMKKFPYLSVEIKSN